MQQIAKWEIFEAAFTSGARYANPFVEVEFGAVFSCGERRVAVDGFYDGEQEGLGVWRVRFAPDAEGAWSFATRSSDPSLNGRTGVFTCGPAAGRGGLRVNPRFPNWFVREDGSDQMICNEGWYPHPANGIDLAHEVRDFKQPGEADFNQYIDHLADHGVNLVIDIAQLYARQTAVTDPTFRWPWKVLDAEHNKFDTERFNLGYYRRMERMLAHARSRELFFAVELLYDNSVVRPREWSHHPLNRANGGWLESDTGIGWSVMFDLDNAVHCEHTERYLRYTIARLAAYWNVLWSVGSENGNLAVLPATMLPGSLMSTQKLSDWYNHWGDLIARRDPYGRLRTYGDAGKVPEMETNLWNSFILTQDPRNYRRDDVSYYYKAMNAFGEEFWKYGRPTVIGEMTASTNNHYEVERRLYWIGFVSGYHMGRSDRHFGTVIDGRLVETDTFGLPGEPPIYPDIRRLSDFVAQSGVRFWRMHPADELLDEGGSLAFCLAAPGEEYVVYLVGGGSVSLRLPDGRATWYNPRTGVFSDAGRTAGDTRFTAPDGEDWVLRITADTRV